MQTSVLTTYQAPFRTSQVATAMLVLTLLQGTSFTLTLAVKSAIASDLLVSLVTLVWLSMYMLAGCGLIVSYGLNWVTWLVRYRLLLTLLLAGTAFSAVWSVDAALSTERIVHLVGSTVVALYLGFSLPLARMLRVSAIVLGLLMMLSVISVYAQPSLGLESYEGLLVWSGVMASKNTLGFWSAVTTLLLVSLSFWTISLAKRLLYLTLAGFSIFCLYNSVSATSVLALLSASLVMLYLHTAFSLRLGMVAMLVLGVLVAGMVAMGFYYIDTAELIGRSGDLTGRGDVWTQTWKLILERPLTGYGYGTLWYPTADSLWIQQTLTDFSWTVFHAHNGLLQLASEIGLPLAALALIMIIQQVVEIIYCQYQRQQPGVLFVLGFTVALLVSNYSEARLLVNRELYWIFFIALPVSMLQQISMMAPITVGIGNTLSVSMGGHVERHARDQLEQRRTLKQRLRNRRKVTIINAQDSASAATTNAAVTIKDNTAHHGKLIGRDTQDSLKRKLARRQRKAG